MYQTLFFIPAKIAGYPVFGSGLLLALWAVASVVLLGYLAWRQGWTTDTWSYVPLLLVLGAIVRWVLPAVCEPQGLPIRGYGVMIMLAVVAGTALAVWRAKRVGVDPETVYSLVFWLLVPGIIGARAFYVIEYWKTQYVPAYTGAGGGLGPLLGEIVNVSKGGLVVYGAFFGGVTGFLLFVRKFHLPLLAVCDLMAPSMVLGLAIGRIGCLMNGCCFGAVCDYPWAVTFPDGAPPYQAQVERGLMYGLSLSANPNSEPRVLAVRHNSEAERAGLKAGDRLQALNRREIATCEDAYVALRDAFCAPAATGDDRRARLNNCDPGRRAARAQPAGASDTDLQCHRRPAAVSAAADCRPIPPARRSAVRADDVGVSCGAFRDRIAANG